MWLDDTERRSDLEREFTRIHAELRRGAGSSAARAIIALASARRADKVTGP
jgi:hypothetical protein